MTAVADVEAGVGKAVSEGTEPLPLSVNRNTTPRLQQPQSTTIRTEIYSQANIETALQPKIPARPFFTATAKRLVQQNTLQIKRQTIEASPNYGNQRT